MHPPTPPSSLPPSPKREQLTSLDGDMDGNQHVKVPDSLPTPPHQIPEMADEFPSSKFVFFYSLQFFVLFFNFCCKNLPLSHFCVYFTVKILWFQVMMILGRCVLHQHSHRFAAFLAYELLKQLFL